MVSLLFSSQPGANLAADAGKGRRAASGSGDYGFGGSIGANALSTSAEEFGERSYEENGTFI